MFHQKYRVCSLGYHAIENLQQSGDILGMETGGGFVQYEQESFRVPTRQCLRNA